MAGSQPPTGETFGEFKDSFSYGRRTHLDFKFLKRLDEDRAARFFFDLAAASSRLLDGDPPDALIDLIIETQAAAYAPAPGAPPKYAYADRPFAELRRPPAQATAALVSSGGHFPEGADPAPLGRSGMTQEEAIERISEFMRLAPALTEIPVDLPAARLRVRHGGYHIAGAEKDPEVVLPRRAMAEAVIRGRLGRFADPCYSFVGAASQGRIRNEVAPRWAEMLHERDIDLAILVPV